MHGLCRSAQHHILIAMTQVGREERPAKAKVASFTFKRKETQTDVFSPLRGQNWVRDHRQSMIDWESVHLLCSLEAAPPAGNRGEGTQWRTARRTYCNTELCL